MQVGFFKPLVPRRPCLTTLRRMTAQPTSTRFSQEDALFRTYLEDLPGPLLDALVKRKLTDPGLLRAYPRSSPEKLGILALGSTTLSSGPTWSTNIGIVDGHLHARMRQLWSPHRHSHCLLLLLLSHSLTPTLSHIHLVQRLVERRASDQPKLQMRLVLLVWISLLVRQSRKVLVGRIAKTWAELSAVNRMQAGRPTLSKAPKHSV